MIDTRQQAVDAPTAIMASSLLLVVAAAIWLIMPVYAGAAAVSLHLDDSQVGSLASADFAGLALASLFAPLWIRRVNWRVAASVGLTLMLLGNFASVYVDTFSNLLTIRFLTEFACGGVASIGLASLADTTKTDRNFAIAIAAQTVFGSAALLGLPYLVERWGLDSVFVSLNVVTLLVFPCIRFLTAQGKDHEAEMAVHRSIVVLPILGLIGMTLFFANIGALWAYIERIGSAAGLLATYIGQSLAFSNAVALGGALAAAWIGDRFGHLRPMILVAVLQLTALALLNVRLDAATFIIALSIYSFFWNFAIPYQMTVTANADPTGRLIVLATAFQGAGAALGPGLVAWLVKPNTFGAVYLVAAACSVACLLVFSIVIRRTETVQ
jgi:MFS family permease